MQAVPCRAFDGKALPPRLTQCLSHGLEVERLMHGIACSGMIELKVQMRPGGQTSAGPAQGNAGGGEGTESVPGVGSGEPRFGLICRRHPAPTRFPGFQRS
jgi:hypothetical protein